MTEIEIVRIAVAPANASALKAPISEWRSDYFRCYQRHCSPPNE
jgi:hypothetical protein